MNGAECTDREHSELTLLYNATVTEIAAFKQQQWSITYYVLAIHAALVAAAQTIRGLNPGDRFLLCSLAALTLGLGLVVLRALHLSIEARRTRLCKAREHFGEPFKNARSVSKEHDPVSVILAIAQVVGAIIAAWFIAARI